MKKYFGILVLLTFLTLFGASCDNEGKKNNNRMENRPMEDMYRTDTTIDSRSMKKDTLDTMRRENPNSDMLNNQ